MSRPTLLASREGVSPGFLPKFIESLRLFQYSIVNRQFLFVRVRVYHAIPDSLPVGHARDLPYFFCCFFISFNSLSPGITISGSVAKFSLRLLPL